MKTLYKNNMTLLENTITDVIPNIINSHISLLYDDKDGKNKIARIYESLRCLLNGHYEKYRFNENALDKMLDNGLSETQFQKILSELNEKQSIRKTKGVYYTPKDVVSFIIANCFKKLIEINDTNVINGFNDLHSLDNLEILNDLLYNKTVLDPTCGSGEFLITALQVKIHALKNSSSTINDDTILTIVGTIHGNDINVESIEITKIRLFFEIIKDIKDTENYIIVANTLNNNLHNVDFVNMNRDDFNTYDIVFGNPPYVEDGKSEIKPNIKYGNIYANVIQNSVDLLTDTGAIGFIVPISYTSTPRMRRIRRYIEENTTVQYVLNYADRPDCLFTAVHQKLSILIASKGNGEHKVFTSGYKYWYKAERQHLFSNCKMQLNTILYEEFYPKIGNETELSIFEKVFTTAEDSIFNAAKPRHHSNVFLNMRACFWIKAFSFNPGSKEYKGFGFEDKHKGFMLCLLNSTLFFLFWITISDCWHITAKELKHFKVPKIGISKNVFGILSKQLEDDLENTKKYIGTKQTEYEYKHKLCKATIDKIDESLAAVYHLTKEEVGYIKSYASKYRESLGG